MLENPLPIAVSIIHAGRGARVTCAGEIDIHTEDAFVSAVDQALSTRPESLELDLRAVTFFGSEGIAALLRATRTAESLGVRLRVLPSRFVRWTLELAGVAGAIPLVPDPGESAPKAESATPPSLQLQERTGKDRDG